jgi:hypothetical protein
MFLFERLAAVEAVLVMVPRRFNVCFFGHNSLFYRAAEGLSLCFDESEPAIIICLRL